MPARCVLSRCEPVSGKSLLPVRASCLATASAPSALAGCEPNRAKPLSPVRASCPATASAPSVLAGCEPNLANRCHLSVRSALRLRLRRPPSPGVSISGNPLPPVRASCPTAASTPSAFARCEPNRENPLSPVRASCPTVASAPSAFTRCEPILQKPLLPARQSVGA